MRSTNYNSTTLLKTLLTVVVVIAILYFGRTFLIPLAIGALLAALFHPLSKWLEGKGINRLAASLLCMLILLLCIAGICALIGWQVADISKDFEMIRQRVGEMVGRVQEFFYTQMGIPVEKQKKMMEDQHSGAAKVLPVLAAGVSSILSSVLLIHVYLVLLLYFRRHIREFILMLAPVPEREEVKAVIYDAAEVSHQYLFGLSKMIACLWVMYGIGFSLLGVKNAFFFALLCGTLEIIPFVGNIAGTGITVLVTAIQGGSTAMIGGIIAVYLGIQFIQTWVLEPLVVGRAVKINAFATIVALVAGELLWGIPGMILAIPLTGMLKIVCDHVTALRPFGFLLGELKDKKPSGIKKFFKGLFK